MSRRKRSGGPNTEEGKRVSSQNATQHGLTGKRHVILPGESEDEYNDMLLALFRQYVPINEQERQLVLDIAQNRWRIDRVRRLETATFESAMKTAPDTGDPDHNMANAFHSRGADFDRIRRYETTLTRAWHRSVEQLQKLIADRRKSEPDEDASLDEVEEFLCNRMMRNEMLESQFVSQNAEEPADESEINPAEGPPEFVSQNDPAAEPAQIEPDRE